MNSLSRIGLLISLIGFLIGCAVPAAEMAVVRHETWSEDVWFSEPQKMTRGLGVGFMRPEDRHKPIHERASNDQFHVRAGDPFTTRLLLNTGSDLSHPVAIAIFLDYEQVTFGLDGQWGQLHYLEIPPAVDMEIPLEVPVNTSGWRDLFVTVFSEPEGRPIDPQTRLPPSFPAVGRRTVVCVGACIPPEPDERLPEARVGEVVGVQRTSPSAMPLLPDDGRPAKERLLLATKTRPGAAFALELWARNPADNITREYVIVPVLNFQQTSFEGDSLLHLRMPPGSELFLPGHVQLPKAKGTHELQFIVIFDPYLPLQEVQDRFVHAPMSSALIAE